ncbi:MAG: cold-shock protein [Alphaproteobacteria bacterium]|nr:cold-shock protein [Alphaproteobacteria bacterium]NCB49949.1 cold-shock protein [Alphaproteobacteria bacterium]
MYKGQVKWFNTKKGYGFIVPEEGDKDIFVHISALKAAGLNSLDEDQAVEYDLTTENGKTFATNIVVK